MAPAGMAATTPPLLVISSPAVRMPLPLLRSFLSSTTNCAMVTAAALLLAVSFPACRSARLL